jgi:hypothetical protein
MSPEPRGRLFRLVSTGLALVAVLAVVGTGRQRREMRNLRAERDRLQARVESLRAAPPEGQARPTPVTTSGPGFGSGSSTPLSAEERIRLMELRSQVTDLRARRRTLAAVTNETAGLQAKLTSVSNYVLGRTPAGYVRRVDARNLGQATPEAAAQTFFWALEHRNVEALLRLISAGESAALERVMQEKGPGGLFEEAPPFAGFRVAGRREKGPDEVELELEIGPQKPWVVTFQREEGVWRMGE